ncbi:MAG TPA: choice-of-anchor tandem repeat GloVer-containing protein [Verrucomicrobiae bacterium]|jgi:uncharacterized repeat protein (TIGR03803 family)
MKWHQKFVVLTCIAALCLAASRANAALNFTTLISFNGTNGANPACNLVEGPNGNFYGTAPNGGAYSNGAVFEISSDGSFFTDLYSFTGGTNGSGPVGALIPSANGLVFYGTTFGGGASNCGTIYQISSLKGAFTQLGSLSGTNGANPIVALALGTNGTLYGAAKYGGAFTNVTSGGGGYGTVFQISTSGGSLTNPVLFADTNGANPSALIMGSDGNFYGTTAWGGNVGSFKLGFGTVFRLGQDGTFTDLHNLNGGSDGGFPYANLLQASDGNFYGCTFNGGAYSGGDIFQVTPQGQFRNLYSFTGGLDGAFPYSALVQGSDGNLYGTTYSYGANGDGAIFQISTNGNLTPLVNFTGTTGIALGVNPEGSLVQGTDGNFYGTTYYGGTYNQGTVFQLSLPLPPVFTSVSAVGGTVTLIWSAVATQTYQLQCTTNLAQPNWTDLGSAVVATNGTMTATNSVGSDLQRFYQVVVQ